MEVCAVVDTHIGFRFTVLIQYPIANNGNANLSYMYMYSLCCFVSIKGSLHMLVFLPSDRKNCTMITDLTMDVFIIMLMRSPGLDPRITLSSEGAGVIGRSENYLHLI